MGYVIMALLQQILFRPHLAMAQVKEVEISKDIYKSGLILRQETVLTAQQDGHVLFYVNNFDRVEKTNYLYFIDASGEFQELVAKEKEGDEELTAQQKKEINRQLLPAWNQMGNTDLHRLRTVHQFLHDIPFTSYTTDELKKLIESYQKDHSLDIVTSEVDGIYINQVDGYEGINPEELDESLRPSKTPVQRVFLPNSVVTAGDPIGKMITSENWSVLVPATEKDLSTFTEGSEVTIQFKDDDRYGNAIIHHYPLGDKIYLELEFDRGVIRYAGQRFCQIRIPQQHLKGYQLPKSCIWKDGDVTGVYRLNTGLAEFKPVEILAEYGDDYIVSLQSSLRPYDQVALDPKHFAKGGKLVR